MGQKGKTNFINGNFAIKFKSRNQLGLGVDFIFPILFLSKLVPGAGAYIGVIFVSLSLRDTWFETLCIPLSWSIFSEIWSIMPSLKNQNLRTTALLFSMETLDAQKNVFSYLRRILTQPQKSNIFLEPFWPNCTIVFTIDLIGKDSSRREILEVFLKPPYLCVTSCIDLKIGIGSGTAYN